MPLSLYCLRRLDRAIGRAVRRALGRGFHGGGLGLAERRALVGELDLRDVRHRRPGLRAGGRVAEARKHGGAAHQHEPGQERRGASVSPRSHASTSSESPALNSRRSRSSIIRLPPLMRRRRCDPRSRCSAYVTTFLAEAACLCGTLRPRVNVEISSVVATSVQKARRLTERSSISLSIAAAKLR